MQDLYLWTEQPSCFFTSKSQEGGNKGGQLRNPHSTDRSHLTSLKWTIVGALARLKLLLNMSYKIQKETLTKESIVDQSKQNNKEISFALRKHA